MVNIGIIGLGGMGCGRIKLYGKLDNAQVVALCDKDPERAKGRTRTDINIEYGGESCVEAVSYTDYRDLLADLNVDAVDICLPTALHADTAVAALEAGKHVICEKPMALSVEECDRMIAAADASGKVLMVAHCIRFWPDYLAIKAIVDSGEYGKVKSANFRRLSAIPSWSSDGWMADPGRSGGCILDLHIHDADFITYLFGLPQSVVATGTTSARGNSYVCATYQYGDDKVIHAESSWFDVKGFPFIADAIVQLERAAILLDSARGPLTVFPREGEPFTPEVAGPDPYTAELSHFLNCIEDGVKPTVVTPRDARESVRMVLAEEESIRSGQPAPVAESAPVK